MNSKSTYLAKTISIATIIVLGFPGLSSADHRNDSGMLDKYGYQSNDNSWRSHQGEGRNCSRYEVRVRGGDGAFRFMHNIPDYKIVRNGVYRGKICGERNLTVELSKRHPGTHVALRINGEKYNFGRGDHGHRYVNNWHRRYFRIPAAHDTRHGYRDDHKSGWNRKHDRKHDRYAQYHRWNKFGYNQHH